jgi:hypothetical protein
MTTAVRISKKLVDHAKIKSKVENRSITGQIEYRAKIGKIAEENPDLSFYQIKEIMTGIELLENEPKSEYKFG